MLVCRRAPVCARTLRRATSIRIAAIVVRRVVVRRLLLLVRWVRRRQRRLRLRSARPRGSRRARLRPRRRRSGATLVHARGRDALAQIFDFALSRQRLGERVLAHVAVCNHRKALRDGERALAHTLLELFEHGEIACAAWVVDGRRLDLQVRQQAIERIFVRRLQTRQLTQLAVDHVPRQAHIGWLRAGV